MIQYNNSANENVSTSIFAECFCHCVNKQILSLFMGETGGLGAMPILVSTTLVLLSLSGRAEGLRMLLGVGGGGRRR